MAPITKLLPLFALLATLANASIDPRGAQLEDMKAHSQEHDKRLGADVDQSEYQRRRSFGDELGKDIKEDPSYCGPAGSPVSSRPHTTPHRALLSVQQCDVLQPHNTFPIHDHVHDEVHARDGAGDSKFGSGNRAKGWKREDGSDESETMVGDFERGEEPSDRQTGSEMHDNDSLEARRYKAGNSKFGSGNRAKGWKREDGSDDDEEGTLEARDRAGNSKFGSGNRAKGWKREDGSDDFEAMMNGYDAPDGQNGDEMHEESTGDSKFGSGNRAKGWKRGEDEGDDTGDSKFGSGNRAKGWKREEDEDAGDARLGSGNRAKGWKREEDEDMGDAKFGSGNRAKGWKREEEDEDMGDAKFGSGNRAKGWKRRREMKIWVI